LEKEKRKTSSKKKRPRKLVLLGGGGKQAKKKGGQKRTSTVGPVKARRMASREAAWGHEKLQTGKAKRLKKNIRRRRRT